MIQLSSNAIEEQRYLFSEIKSFIESGVDGTRKNFTPLALRLFRFQYANNIPYQQYCDAKGVDPLRVEKWKDIPAFPADVFKREFVTSFAKEDAVMAQITSGTTANERGKIFRDEMGRELVLLANRVMTGSYLFPEHEKDVPRPRVLILAPSPEMAPSMGMAVGMDETRKHFGSADSRFLMARSGIDIKGMITALDSAELSGAPVALIGSTSAFVYFFQACKKRSISFTLPSGSRIGDGGGYYGSFGDMTRQQYYRYAESILGIPETHCVNVLGMAESATNFFENSLRNDYKANKQTDDPAMVPPPWVRTDVVDVETLESLPPGKVGLLRHFDLANLPTVLGVQSDNLGITNKDGSFRILGRAKLEKGKISKEPARRTVGPMGDKKILRFLESYVNFSIQFKMGRITGRKPKSMGGACPCGEGIEQMLVEDDKSHG